MTRLVSLRRRGFCGAMISAVATGGAFASEINDGLGRRMVLGATPRRVVAIAGPAVAEMSALGLRPVGTTLSPLFERYAGYPLPGPSPVAWVANADGTPNLERIRALEPDLITAWSGEHAELLGQIAPVFIVRGVPTLAAARLNLLQIGHMLGQGAAAAAIVAAFDLRAKAYAKLVTHRGSLVTVGSSIGRRFSFHSRANMVTEVLDLVSDAHALAPVSRGLYVEGSIESLHAMDPDAILLVVSRSDGRTDVPSSLAEDDLWQRLRAVRAGRVIAVNNFTAVTWQSIPSAWRLLDLVAPLLHPDDFPTPLTEVQIASAVRD